MATIVSEKQTFRAQIIDGPKFGRIVEIDSTEPEAELTPAEREALDELMKATEKAEATALRLNGTLDKLEATLARIKARQNAKRRATR